MADAAEGPQASPSNPGKQEAERILTRQGQLESARAVWEFQWREIAERVLPRQDDFQKQRYVEGQKRMQFVFDATPILALDKFASAVDSLVTPAEQMYQKLVPGDESLYNKMNVRRYLDETNKILFRERYRPQANFANQIHESWISLGAFGTQGIYCGEIPGKGIRYKSISLVELYIAENAYGQPDLVHRKFRYTARQAMQAFGDNCPKEIKEKLRVNPLEKFTFVHAVEPNEDRDPNSLGPRGMRYKSTYVCTDTGSVVETGGFRTMPYIVSRHSTSPRETYGWSPAMLVLPDIKMLNEMSKTIIRAAHKVVDPPLLLYGTSQLNAFSTRPNALNYGGVDDQGRQLVKPLMTNADIPLGIQLLEERRKVVNDAFLVTLFQILVDNPQMTATEAMLRAQEKGQLLAPTMGRQQSECLGPLTTREIDILSEMGVIPSPPDELVEAGYDAFKIEYSNPLAHLRRQTDAVAILNTIEQLTPIANAGHPEVFDRFDPDALTTELCDINGVPSIVLRSQDEIDAMREQKAQAAATAQSLQAVQAAAAASRDAASAAQQAGFVRPALP